MKIIAIDAGGTRTRFGGYDLEGKLIYGFERPSLHPLQVGYKAMARGIKEGVELCLAEIDETEYILSLGLAGYGQNTKIRKSIERALDKQFSDIRIILHNDVECALMAALQGKDGIMLVAGTGSIALRSLHGQKSRTGGWGYLVGDEGSAYWIGRELLGVFSKQADGRLPKTELYEALMDSLVLDDPSELIQILSSHKRPKDAIAALARVAYLASEKGDIHAKSIFTKAAQELALLVKTLNYQSPSVIPVMCTGGVFESGETILEPLREALGEPYLAEPSAYPPMYGAYLYAKQTLGEVI